MVATQTGHLVKEEVYKFLENFESQLCFHGVNCSIFEKSGKFAIYGIIDGMKKFISENGYDVEILTSNKETYTVGDYSLELIDKWYHEHQCAYNSSTQSIFESFRNKEAIVFEVKNSNIIRLFAIESNEKLFSDELSKFRIVVDGRQSTLLAYAQLSNLLTLDELPDLKF